MFYCEYFTLNSLELDDMLILHIFNDTVLLLFTNEENPSELSPVSTAIRDFLHKHYPTIFAPGALNHIIYVTTVKNAQLSYFFLWDPSD